MKERRRALISPWPPSLDLLHSGRADEMKSDGRGERGRERRSVGGGRGQASCQVSPHFKLSCESTITVSAAHNRGAVGEPCCTRLQIKHYRAAIICRATLLRRFCCISTFSATKCSQPRSNCASGRMELLTIRFMSDPDPSPESRGLAVTSPSRCFHAEPSLDVFYVFISASVIPPSEVGAKSSVRFICICLFRR